MKRQHKIPLLRTSLEKIYLQHSRELPFHGWHHVTFITKKAIEFAQSINADTFLVESAALVHDMNYIVKPNSEPDDGADIRQEYLLKAGYTKENIDRIEAIIQESHTATRSTKISDEGKALSDADTLFKALPITPVLFANKYIYENNTDIYQLADKITSEQNRLMKIGIYFYTPLARERYLSWAELNLNLWNQIKDVLSDEDVQEMLKLAKNLDVI